MLIELRCNKFIEPVLNFYPGLNGVIGDNASSNSIGKSSLLMIIDFIFGGSSFTTKDASTLKEIGHLTFFFQLQFRESFYLSRNTEDEDIIRVCDNQYNYISDLSLKEYLALLKQHYTLPNPISFRSAISPFSRIWRKDSANVDKPIQNFPKESDEDAITNLIKLFDQYSKIEKTQTLIKEQSSAKRILQGAFKRNYIERISKTEFQQNEKQLELIQESIETIRKELLQFTVNIERLSSKDLIALKSKRKRVLDDISGIDNKLTRLNLSLTKDPVKSKYFERLVEFFPNVNQNKVKTIETFHTKLNSILTREIKNQLGELREEKALLDSELTLLDEQIATLLKNVDTPQYIIDKVYELTLEANALKNKNKFYQERVKVAEDLQNLKAQLNQTQGEILKDIQERINSVLVVINKDIHSADKKIPTIQFKSISAYSFDHSSNTGTGKSYADLIEFDLAILTLTNLPFVIHDSILFKNIEHAAVDRIISQYTSMTKQIFISLDGINRYSKATQKALTESAVIHLSKKRLLFDKDWS